MFYNINGGAFAYLLITWQTFFQLQGGKPLVDFLYLVEEQSLYDIVAAVP